MVGDGRGNFKQDGGWRDLAAWLSIVWPAVVGGALGLALIGLAGWGVIELLRWIF